MAGHAAEQPNNHVMKVTSAKKKRGTSRRKSFKLSGLALDGLATVGGTSKHGNGNPNAPLDSYYPDHFKTEQDSCFNQLKPLVPWGWDINSNLTGTSRSGLEAGDGD